MDVISRKAFSKEGPSTSRQGVGWCGVLGQGCGNDLDLVDERDGESKRVPRCQARKAVSKIFRLSHCSLGTIANSHSSFLSLVCFHFQQVAFRLCVAHAARVVPTSFWVATCPRKRGEVSGQGIIYFKYGGWKLNDEDDTGGWCYEAAQDSSMPPMRAWSTAVSRSSVGRAPSQGRFER